MVKLSVVDEFGELEKEFGQVADKALKAIVDAAKQHEMACISFISFDAQTRFNEPQAYEIKKELETLQKDPSLEESVLDTIEKARQVALSDVHLFIKFEPVLGN